MKLRVFGFGRAAETWIAGWVRCHGRPARGHGSAAAAHARACRAALIGVTALLTVGAVWAQDGPFALTYEPVFASQSTFSGCYPIAVTVTNSGAHATGVLRLCLNDYVTVYPVDLPTGSTKRVMMYASFDDYQAYAARIELDTDHGGDAIPQVPMPSGGQSTTVMYVGSKTGVLNFLRPQTNRGPGLGANLNVVAGDAYGKPGTLPDRAYGYSGLTSIVLGNGAEHLTDPEIRAIKTWVMTGGSLVFVAGTPNVLSDARWRDVLPVKNIRRVGTPELSSLATTFGSAPPRAATLETGDPAGGRVQASAGDYPVVLSRSLGMGKVFYFGISPFDKALKSWPGRAKLVVNGAFLYGVGQAMQSMDAHVAQTSNGLTAPPGSSPFNVRLPAAETVFLILLGYLVVVVPVNFLILRKLRLGERAWITAPIISLAFAGALFMLAGELYRYGLTRDTQGVLIVDARAPDAYFLGCSRLFVPHGGQYDLGLSNVEHVSLTGPNRDSTVVWNDEQRQGGMQMLDTGMITVPNLSVTNLAFREAWLRQRVKIEGRVRLEGFRLSGKGVEGALVNDTPYTIDRAVLITGRSKLDLGRLVPHQRMLLGGRKPRPRAEMAYPNDPGPATSPAPPGVEEATQAPSASSDPLTSLDSDDVLLYGLVTGAPVGAGLGQQADTTTGIETFWFLGTAVSEAAR